MSTDNEATGVALEKAGRFALVPSHHKIQALSKRFRWKPETVIARIERALPSVVEQQIYLEIGPDYRIRPESLSTILRTYMGERQLQMTDLEDNLSYFEEVAEYLGDVLILVEKSSLQYGDIGLGMETASRLVMAYGEHAEQIVDSIVANVDELGVRLNMEHRSPNRIVGYAIHFLVWTIMEYNHSHGCPEVTNILDYFQDGDKLFRFTVQEYLGLDEPDDRDMMFRVKELGRTEY